MNSDHLRPYQKEATYKLHASINAGRHPVFCAPTGTGKTKTAVKFIYDRTTFDETVWILVPQIEIFNQWLIELSESGLQNITGFINDEGVTGKNKKIYVVMPMSLANIMSLLPENFRPDGIITDEGHRSEATTWQMIYDFYSDSWRACLTATPERTDGQGLDNTYDEIIQTITMQKAVDHGYLAKPLLIVPERYKINIDVPIVNGDYSPQHQAELLGKTQIIGDIIKQYSQVFNGLPVIVACSTYEHAEKMTAAFNDAGWKFEHIHSKLSPSDRAGILRRVRTGKINGICSVGIGVEGLDIPGLFGLIWLRRTLSVTIYLQFIGRVLRPMPGKKYGIIIDPVGNVFIHGRPEMPREWKLTGRDGVGVDPEIMSPKMKICPVCSVMNAADNIICHICEYDFTSERPEGSGRKLPSMVDGELVILDESEFVEREMSGAVADDNGADGKEKEIPIELSQSDKMNLLKSGLEKRKGIFAETLKEWM